MLPTCDPDLASNVTMCPCRVATETICPSGLQARARPSLASWMTSLVAVALMASQIRSVLSQETVASIEEVGEGEKATPPRGPS